MRPEARSLEATGGARSPLAREARQPGAARASSRRPASPKSQKRAGVPAGRRILAELRERVLPAIAAGALGLAGCDGQLSLLETPSSPGATPSVALVTLDTLRADHCSAYGYARRTTPSLDALAAQGALFETAYAPSATTLPSHATLFTSLHPGEHGAVRNGLTLGEVHTTLAESFRAHGYETAAFVSSFVLNRRFGLEQGFGRYDDDFGGVRGTVRPSREWEAFGPGETFDRRARDTVLRAIEWLRARDGSRPFLLWVHLFDPHGPYDPPEPFRSEFVSAGGSAARGREIDLYDGDVRYADSELGRLIEALDEASSPARTIVVVTADHGEGLWDHGWLEHGVHLYEEAVRVPFVIRWRGRIAPGMRVPGLVGLVDVLPSLLSLAGVRRDAPGMRGIDLGPALTLGRAIDPDRRLFLQRRQYQTRELKGLRIAGPKWALRWRHWKLIHGPEEGSELYDLERDPKERENAAESLPRVAEEMRSDLEAWAAEAAGAAPAETLPEEVRARLRALGYVD
jgi:arylsulfatase A-like enzyme